MLFDRLRALRRTRTLKVLIGGSAVGLAVGGVAAAQQGLLGSAEEEHEAEGEDVALDLEGQPITVATESEVEGTPSEIGGLSETAESPVTSEEVSPQEEPSPVTSETAPSPVSVDTPPSPPSPESPVSPDTPDTPATPDSPEDEGDDD